MLDRIFPSLYFFCRFTSPLLVCFIAVACSNSSTDSGSGVPIKDREIIIDELSFGQQEYFEGEWVTVSLNATGDGVQNLNYDWSVGDGLEFEGQNSGTIRFIAPQVSGAGSVTVRVDLSLDDGNLVGARSQQGSVTILDTDPPNILSAGLITELTEVEQLAIPDFSSEFAVATFERYSTDMNGQAADVQRVQKYSAKLQDIDNEPTLVLCGGGSEALHAAISGPVAAAFDCPESLWQERYYQSGNLFRVEKRCDGSVVYATNYVQTFTGNSVVSVNQDDFGLLQDSGEVCLNIVETMVSYYDEAILSPMKYIIGEHTELKMEFDQPEGPIVFELNSESSMGRFERFNLNRLTDPQNPNQVKIAAPQQERLDQMQATGGGVFVNSQEPGKYEIEWDLTFAPDSAGYYSVEANAVIDLP